MYPESLRNTATDLKYNTLLIDEKEIYCQGQITMYYWKVSDVQTEGLVKNCHISSVFVLEIR